MRMAENFISTALGLDDNSLAENLLSDMDYNPGKLDPDLRKVDVISLFGFHCVVNRAAEEYISKGAKAAILFTTLGISSTYLQKIPAQPVQRNFLNPTPVSLKQAENPDDLKFSIGVSLRKLNRVTNTDNLLCGRIYDDKNSVWVGVIGDSDKGERNNRFIASICVTRESYSELAVLNIKMCGTDVEIKCTPRTVFWYLPADKKNLTNSIENKMLSDTISVSTGSGAGWIDILKYIDYILRYVYQEKKMNITSDRWPVYSEEELRLYKHLDDILNLVAADNHSSTMHYFPSVYFNQYDERNEGDIFEEFNKNVGEAILGMSYKEDQPIVALNLKEWAFIERYCLKQPTRDLTKILAEPRLGKVCRMTCDIYDDEHNKHGSADITFSVVLSGNKLRVYGMSELNSTQRYIMASDFDDVDQFDMVQCTRCVTSGIQCKGGDDLLCSRDEYLEKYPVMHMSFKNFLMLCQEIIEMYIVMYDRPARTRIVRCTEQVYKKPKKGKKKGEQPEPEFKVTRLLKTVNDAKDMVNQANNMPPGSRRMAEYTVECWAVSGHWRTYPNGHTVWINSHESHRRKPMAQKEIHIKL